MDQIRQLPTSTLRMAAWTMFAGDLAESDLRSALADAQESGGNAYPVPLLKRLAELGYSAEVLRLVQMQTPRTTQLSTLLSLGDKLGPAEVAGTLQMINALDSAAERASFLYRALWYL